MGEAPRTGGAALLAVLALAGGAAAFERTETRAPCAAHDPLRTPWFGDLHVHTAYSLDASTQGTRTTPREAYRFARGGPLGIQPWDDRGAPGRTLRLARPLDFAAVTDHAELFGELATCRTPGLPGHRSLVCAIYRGWPRLAFFLMNSRAANDTAPRRYGFCGPGARDCLAAARTPWADIQAAAEEAYDRSAACAFTSFVGYEWTGAPGSNNLHRNVVFRNHVVPGIPTTYYEAPEPALLWRALAAGCTAAGTGCDALAIPHNSNLSGGLMFRTEHADGSPLAAAEARERAAFEPLVEVMQHKGDSECRPGAGTADELCGFEKLPYDNFAGYYRPSWAEPPRAANFVRPALAEGLRHLEATGANPFKLGLVASTDTHLGAPGLVREDAHPGHGGAGPPTGRTPSPGLPDAIEFNPGGLAVLWAEENSRDALFAAMRRREAYGTSGPRLVVRLFGGWEYPAGLCADPAFVARGYAGGVPMGGDLPPRRAGAGGPTFAVSALGDPGTDGAPGAPLERVQIVKLWVTRGATHERVWDVAGAAGRGGGADPATCRARGEGPASLCAVWRDPEFDPAAPALWYARVLEAPTCRWHTWICNARGVDCRDLGDVPEALAPCCDPRYPRTIQERAWTSPIWYAPGDAG